MTARFLAAARPAWRIRRPTIGRRPASSSTTSGTTGITGAVVDQHHLEVRPVEGLLGERCQARTQQLGTVVGGDQHADARRPVRRGPVDGGDAAPGVPTQTRWTSAASPAIARHGRPQADRHLVGQGDRALRLGAPAHREDRQRRDRGHLRHHPPVPLGDRGPAAGPAWWAAASGRPAGPPAPRSARPGTAPAARPGRRPARRSRRQGRRRDRPGRLARPPRLGDGEAPEPSSPASSVGEGPVRRRVGAQHVHAGAAPRWRPCRGAPVELVERECSSWCSRRWRVSRWSSSSG